jgi:pimeloyl-ACP methyl ester carboxylesterase
MLFSNDVAETTSLSCAGSTALGGERQMLISGKSIRGVAGVLLCAFGFLFARTSSHHERKFLIDAEGCRLETSILEPASSETHGSVVLLHGLASNKKLMSYVAEGFVAQGLRVFVPDLPGHGKTQGPFSPARAEQCTESLVRELLLRGLITPKQTILAGHSMGGAIAVRVAARIPVSGVIAISPAPMKPSGDTAPEMLLYTNPPALPENSLIVSGGWELKSMRNSAIDLQASRNDGTTKLAVLPAATHVSLLFDPRTVRVSQEWAARLLGVDRNAALPSHRDLIGAFVGFAGILLIAGPFLREIAGEKKEKKAVESAAAIGTRRSLLEIGAATLGVVGLLHFSGPLRLVYLFEGDYLATFLWVTGFALVVLHAKTLRSTFSRKAASIFGAACGAFVLFLLITAWFDLTVSESWLTSAKWARFPVLLILLLPYHAIEEILLGPTESRRGWRRLTLALSFRLVAWFALAGGVFYLHSGEVLLVLLAPYMALFNLLQRTGADCVRDATGSPAAAAVFGAILQAGFCLVIFPIT